MRDETIDRLARLIDAGHIRWRDGRVQLHADCPEADRVWLRHHRDDVTAVLTPFPDEATTIAYVRDVFSGTVAIARIQPQQKESHMTAPTAKDNAT